MLEWRALQEDKLRKKVPDGTHLMSHEEIAISSCITSASRRNIMAEMPARADWVLEIAASHAITALRSR